MPSLATVQPEAVVGDMVHPPGMQCRWWWALLHRPIAYFPGGALQNLVWWVRAARPWRTLGMSFLAELCHTNGLGSSFECDA